VKAVSRSPCKQSRQTGVTSTYAIDWTHCTQPHNKSIPTGTSLTSTARPPGTACATCSGTAGAPTRPCERAARCPGAGEVRCAAGPTPAKNGPTITLTNSKQTGPQRKKPDSTPYAAPLVLNPVSLQYNKFSTGLKGEGATYLGAYVNGSALRAAGRVQRKGQHERVGHEVEGRPVPLAQLTALAQEVQAAERGMLIRVLCKIQCNTATRSKPVVNCCVVTPVAAIHPDNRKTQHC
jgi:hypothetical protein